TARQTQIDVRDFIQHNYTPYEGDESFLADATPATTALWEQVMAGIRVENATHAPVDFDTNVRRGKRRSTFATLFSITTPLTRAMSLSSPTRRQ
ncbi:hypothetical protein, partial [Enterococcus faecium]|uniref:hypothetical protein n=1 Tax=Enterococcus faecium TaxID=1352 RepID=UPI003F9F7558